MAKLTPAEKQRRYRELLKNNPITADESLRKDRERKMKTRKKIVDLTERGQRSQRKACRRYKEKSRQRKKHAEALHMEAFITPPSTSTLPMLNISSNSDVSSRKKVRKILAIQNRRKIVKKNLNLKTTIQKLQRKIDSMRKHCCKR